MGNLSQDMKYSFRLWARSPGFALVVVLTLGLGIGATTAIFSVVNGVLLQPLPYDQPENIVRLWRVMGELAPADVPTHITSMDYNAWREGSQLLEDVAGYSASELDVAVGDEASSQKILGAKASYNLFDVLGVRPFMGRTFTEEETDDKLPVVVISNSFWRSKFVAADDVLGQTFSIGGKQHEIIGVMPAGFDFPLQGNFWIPQSFQSSITDTGSGEKMERRVMIMMMNAVGRLRPGTSISRLQEELETLSANAREGFSFGGPPTVRAKSYKEIIVGKVRPVLYLISGAVLLILLIACANVANLLLSRASMREREMAVRAAMGAGRGRIVRQLLTESLGLALLGGLVGTLFAYVGLKIFLTAPPIDIPRSDNIGLDLWVLGFAILASVLTGLVFGMVPAFQASRIELTQSLKEGGTNSRAGLNLLRRNRLRALLVGAEVAFSLVLLIGAGLLVNSFLRISFTEPGFKPQNLVTANPRMDFERTQMANFSEYMNTAYDNLIMNLTAIPGVHSAALTTYAPPRAVTSESSVVAEGQFYGGDDATPSAPTLHVSEDYFATMGTPLLRGRVFNRDDIINGGVVILSELAAQTFIRESDPIGSFLVIGDDFIEVIGVSANVRQAGLDKPLEPLLYLPSRTGATVINQTRAGGKQVQMRFVRSMTLLIRTEGDPVALTSHIISAVQDAGMKLDRIQLMEQTLWQSIAQPRFYSYLFGTFAFVALVLAAVGIFGVMSYSVSQSTHEIGIRMALGAQTDGIVRMVLEQGLAVTALGIAAGLAGAFGLTHFLDSYLFGITATDPVTFLLLSLLFLGVAAAACYLPARRATKVDPMVALRYE